MPDKFQNQYRIPSARADWWNYGWNAAYFVTICTAHRECYFGEIISVQTGQCPVSNGNIGYDPETGQCPVCTNNTMQLSEIGRLADKFWWSIPEHFPFVKLDAFVVMPNHIHGILIIDKQNIGVMNDVETGHCPVCDGNDGNHNAYDPGWIVETGHCPVSTNDRTNDHANDRTNAINATDPKTPGEIRFRNQGKHTLSSIIGSYKSVVTKHAHRVHADFEWQERFHDHIIRDRDEYFRIVTYIENNVANWKNDKFYE